MNHSIAIVIPAYKATFLSATLDSIAAQTCKDFTLYVGDDCSPEPIGRIVEAYRDKINMVYQRFDSNLGGTDLVAQWERCIAMSEDEPYIWLFSDDDVMEPNCVEELLRQIDRTNGVYDLYHFDVDRIDERGRLISSKEDYPTILTAYQYYRGKNAGRFSSFAVDNVFSRRIYERHGFVKFDLAWGSDVATWIVFCGEKGMYTVPDARVKWRESSRNITPDNSRQIAERKLRAEMAFLNWSYRYFRKEPNIYAVNRAFFIYKIHLYKKHVSKERLKEAFASFFAVHGKRRDWLWVWTFAFLVDGIYFRIRKRFSWLYGDSLTPNPIPANAPTRSLSPKGEGNLKIIYYSSPAFADCDFPLVGELQRMGHDVRYYIPVASFSKRSTIIDLKELYPHTGIYPATEIYKEFDQFHGLLDLSKVYIVNMKHKQKFHPVNLFLKMRMVLRFMRQKPDVIHLTKQPVLTEKLLYLVRKKLVLTVHDPFLHSGYIDKRVEADRRLAFKKIPKLVLLNDRQQSSFASYYHVPEKRIFLSRLGMYSTILHVEPLPFKTDRPFVLFFGQIAEYKGVEYLLEAMKTVHSRYPELMVVIAGGGKFYFDLEPYKGLDYVKIIHRYIGLGELAGMLMACEFGVCPYKDATQSGVVQTAFTLGVPMVVTDVGALADAVQHGKTGIVVKPCDADILANSIMELYSNKEKLNMMRTYIKNVWTKNMGWESIAIDYLNCYKNIED